MSAQVSVRVPSGDIALTVNLMTELVFNPPYLDVVYINAVDDIYLIVYPSGQDGTAPPTGTGQQRRYRIPAGVCHPYRTTSDRVFLTPVSAATTTAWAIAMASERFPWETRGFTDPCAQ